MLECCAGKLSPTQENDEGKSRGRWPSEDGGSCGRWLFLSAQSGQAGLVQHVLDKVLGISDLIHFFLIEGNMQRLFHIIDQASDEHLVKTKVFFKPSIPDLGRMIDPIGLKYFDHGFNF